MAEKHAAEVLIVDRDPELGRQILAFLLDRDYDVEWVDDDEKAFNRLDSRLFDVLVTDLNIDRVDGMRLMAVAKDRNPDICVVFITEQPDIELATEAMRQGAYDFQTKPLNLAKLEAVIQHGLAYQRLVFEQVELKRRLDERFGLGSLVGRSRQMIQVYNAVREIGPSRETVLIYGEPGTGKDLIAQAIHNSSPRRDEPFVKFDCAGVPEMLAHSELFEQTFQDRARSSAHRSYIELADKGTLYLDSVDEFPVTGQEQFLGVLEEGRLRRSGDGKRIPVDVRVIAATNQRLETLMEAGRFRKDLHARLTAAVIEAPALRARREDIPLLVKRALDHAVETHKTEAAGISRNAMNLLAAYDWPGNVRELQNVIEGMVATARGGGPLGVNDIPEYVRQAAAPDVGEIRIPAGATMREIERTAIEETMKTCAYNKEKCAKALGIGLRTLYRKLKEYDIR